MFGGARLAPCRRPDPAGPLCRWRARPRWPSSRSWPPPAAGRRTRPLPGARPRRPARRRGPRPDPRPDRGRPRPDGAAGRSRRSSTSCPARPRHRPGAAPSPSGSRSRRDCGSTARRSRRSRSPRSTTAAAGAATATSGSRAPRGTRRSTSCSRPRRRPTGCAGRSAPEGRLSCRQGQNAILNLARWVTAHPGLRHRPDRLPALPRQPRGRARARAPPRALPRARSPGTGDAAADAGARRLQAEPLAVPVDRRSADCPADEPAPTLIGHDRRGAGAAHGLGTGRPGDRLAGAELRVRLRGPDHRDGPPHRWPRRRARRRADGRPPFAVRLRQRRRAHRTPAPGAAAVTARRGGVVLPAGALVGAALAVPDTRPRRVRPGPGRAPAGDAAPARARSRRRIPTSTSAPVVDEATLADFGRTLVTGYGLEDIGVPAIADLALIGSLLHLYVGYADGEPVATAGSAVHHGVVEIDWVAVLPEVRGRGFGGAVDVGRGRRRAGAALDADRQRRRAARLPPSRFLGSVPGDDVGASALVIVPPLARVGAAVRPTADGGPGARVPATAIVDPADVVMDRGFDVPGRTVRGLALAGAARQGPRRLVPAAAPGAGTAAPPPRGPDDRATLAGARRRRRDPGLRRARRDVHRRPRSPPRRRWSTDRAAGRWT